ncbi:hypothetical protein ACLOJK_029641 [Asimina triloba]
MSGIVEDVSDFHCLEMLLTLYKATKVIFTVYGFLMGLNKRLLSLLGDSPHGYMKMRSKKLLEKTPGKEVIEEELLKGLCC